MTLARLEPADTERAHAFTNEAFRLQAADDVWTDLGWGLYDEGRLLAVMSLTPVAQYFGGAGVAATIVDHVAVLPGSRGAGVGLELMTEAVERMRADGSVLVSGLPSTHAFYRRLGFQIAGVRNHYRAPLHAFPAIPGAASVEPARDDDGPALQRCFEQFARGTAGLTDRRPPRLETTAAGADRHHCFVVRGSAGSVRGYVAYEQVAVGGAFPYFRIDCSELIWLDAGSKDALHAFLRDQRTLSRAVDWPGPVDDPLLLAYEQQATEIVHSIPWITRVIDVEGALRARGYPDVTTAPVTVQIADPMVGGEGSSYRFALTDGVCDVSKVPSSPGDMQTDIGTFSSLYTGWLSSRSAAHAGLLRGSSERDRSRLDALFSGPKPWLL